MPSLRRSGDGEKTGPWKKSRCAHLCGPSPRPLGAGRPRERPGNAPTTPTLDPDRFSRGIEPATGRKSHKKAKKFKVIIGSMSGTAHVLRSILYYTSKYIFFSLPVTHVAMPSSTCSIWYVAALLCGFIVLPQKTLTKWHCLLPATFCVGLVVSVKIRSRKKKIYTSWQRDVYFPIAERHPSNGSYSTFTTNKCETPPL